MCYFSNTFWTVNCSFSISDKTVDPAVAGGYLAFAQKVRVLSFIQDNISPWFINIELNQRKICRCCCWCLSCTVSRFLEPLRTLLLLLIFLDMLRTQQESLIWRSWLNQVSHTFTSFPASTSLASTKGKKPGNLWVSFIFTCHQCQILHIIVDCNYCLIACTECQCRSLRKKDVVDENQAACKEWYHVT